LALLFAVTSTRVLPGGSLRPKTVDRDYIDKVEIFGWAYNNCLMGQQIIICRRLSVKALTGTSTVLLCTLVQYLARNTGSSTRATLVVARVT
jgi:hypothetical protein